MERNVYVLILKYYGEVLNNMINKEYVDNWLEILLRILQDAFGQRLLLVVNVGSWARNDGNEHSDIDVNVVLDKVVPDDIALYRSIIAGMPDRHLACGFLGGLDEMALWPKYDRMAFYYGCRVLYGSVPEVLGPISRRDIFDNVMVILSNINHAVRHSMIYDTNLIESAHRMRDSYKSAFFVLRGWYLLKHGVYVDKKQDLLDNLADIEDIAVLASYLDWERTKEVRDAFPLDVLNRLERWSHRMFERMANLE